MGVKFELADAAFTRPQLKKIYSRPFMNEGSFFLWDPTHSDSRLTVLPNSGDAVTNLARETASAITGEANLALLDGKFMRSATGAELVCELTPKGGIHVLPSQVGGSANAVYGMVSPMETLQNWIHAHTDDDWYFATVCMLTRKQIATANPCSMLHKAENTANYLCHHQGGGYGYPSSGAALLGRDATPPDSTIDAATGQVLDRRKGTTAFTGTKNAMNNLGAFGNGVGTGTRGLHFVAGAADSWATLNQNKAPGLKKMMDYAEYLPASGRTWDAANTALKAEIARMTGPGGEWHGDTLPTDPATFP